MTRKGFLDILAFVESKSAPYYIDVVNHAVGHKLVESRSQADVALSTFTTFGLAERFVSPTKPVRTSYRITKKGKLVLHNLLQIREFAE